MQMNKLLHPLKTNVMKKTMLPILLALLLSNYLQSQNVGIGTTTPRGP